MASAEPPLDVASASAFAAVPMRRLETHSLEIYYPAARHGLALRVAARLEYCVGELRRRAVIHNGYADRKLVVLMPEAPINNAYVLPPTISLGSFAVVPTYSTLDLIGELDLAFDPGRVGCHEAVHYVHALQVAGVWRWINTIFGDVLTPQIGLDVWFWEGLATYYESELQPGTGRMHSPAWRGMFHAAYAGRNISGSDLDFEQRPFHWGNHYLVGSHFIEFLVRRYGESKLWSTIARQGRTVFFPFLVSLEFRSAYGKTLSGLLDEFASDVATSLPPRVRPAEQHWVRDAGEDARYAVAPDGTEALIAASGDDPIRLRIYDARGRLQRERLLTDVLPFGALSSPDVRMLTGLSFTADARELYFVAVDRGAVQLEARLVRYRLATDELEIVANDLPGSGGGVAPDGRSYYFSQEGGDRADVAVLDLESGRRKLLSRAPPGTYYLGPRPSPDGQRLVAAAAGAGRSHVVVFSARGGAPKAPCLRAPARARILGSSTRAAWCSSAPSRGGSKCTWRILPARRLRASPTPHTSP